MRNVYILFLASSDLGFRRLVMPMGPLIVAGAVRRSPLFGTDDRVYLCDSFGEVQAKAALHKNDRIHFLISSVQIIRGVNAETNPAIACVKKLRRRYPGAFTCVGGPDVSLNRDDYLPFFDLVFQGEVGAVDLLDVLRSGVHFFQAPPADMNAESVDYRLLSGRKYLAGSLQASRGCAYGCQFCNIGHIFGRRVRALDPGRLEERLDSLAAVHRGFVIFGDDNFGGGLEEKALELLDVVVRFQKRRGFPFLFAVQASLQFARSAEVMQKMREADIVAAFIGLESPSPEALSATRKNHNLGSPLAEQVETFVRHGIVPYVSLILGLDREAEEAGARTRELLDECRSPFMMLNLINPAIGSKFREKAAAENRLLDHPLYFRYNLMPLKTDRPYAAIVKDYGEILRWFYDDRRLFGFCDGLERKIREGGNPEGREAFVAGVSTASLLKLFGFYLVICLRSRSWRGFLRMFSLIGRSRADVVYFFLIGGIPLASKAMMMPAVRLVSKGLAKLRAAGLYPFEKETDDKGP